MREIKFRIWDDTDKEMLYVDTPIGTSKGMMVAQVKSYSNSDLEYGWDYSDNDEIMQYTEFKDKNKEPIYFGDIVYIDHYDAYYEIKMVRGYIACVTVGKCKRVDEWSLYGVLESHKVEVVGNKFKNPELLK